MDDIYTDETSHNDVFSSPANRREFQHIARLSRNRTTIYCAGVQNTDNRVKWHLESTDDGSLMIGREMKLSDTDACLLDRDVGETAGTGSGRIDEEAYLDVRSGGDSGGLMDRCESGSLSSIDTDGGQGCDQDGHSDVTTGYGEGDGDGEALSWEIMTNCYRCGECDDCSDDCSNHIFEPLERYESVSVDPQATPLKSILKTSSNVSLSSNSDAGFRNCLRRNTPFSYESKLVQWNDTSRDLQQKFMSSLTSFVNDNIVVDYETSDIDIPSLNESSKDNSDTGNMSHSERSKLSDGYNGNTPCSTSTDNGTVSESLSSRHVKVSNRRSYRVNTNAHATRNERVLDEYLMRKFSGHNDVMDRLDGLEQRDANGNFPLHTDTDSALNDQMSVICAPSPNSGTKIRNEENSRCAMVDNFDDERVNSNSKQDTVAIETDSESELMIGLSSPEYNGNSPTKEFVRIVDCVTDRIKSLYIKNAGVGVEESPSVGVEKNCECTPRQSRKRQRLLDCGGSGGKKNLLDKLREEKQFLESQRMQQATASPQLSVSNASITTAGKYRSPRKIVGQGAAFEGGDRATVVDMTPEIIDLKPGVTNDSESRPVDNEPLSRQKCYKRKKCSESCENTPPPVSFERPPISPLCCDSRSADELTELELDTITKLHTICNAQKRVTYLMWEDTAALLKHYPSPRIPERLQWNTRLESDDKCASVMPPTQRPKPILFERQEPYPFSDEAPSPILVTRLRRVLMDTPTVQHTSL